ncbi:unnamed protein product [Wickerhamomyces anomalus]
MSDKNNKDNHIRFERLNQVCKRALEESMKALSDDNLKMCYPILAGSKEGKDTISAVKDQLKESWSQNSQKEFDAIFKERDIEEKLNQLDDLIIQAQERQKSGDKKQLIHLIPVKEAKLKNLEKQLGDLKSSNENILKELNNLSKEATEIRLDVSNKFQNLEKFNDLAKDSDLSERLKRLIEQLSTEENEQII